MCRVCAGGDPRFSRPIINDLHSCIKGTHQYGQNTAVYRHVRHDKSLHPSELYYIIYKSSAAAPHGEVIHPINLTTSQRYDGMQLEDRCLVSSPPHHADPQPHNAYLETGVGRLFVRVRPFPCCCSPPPPALTRILLQPRGTNANPRSPCHGPGRCVRTVANHSASDTYAPLPTTLRPTATSGGRPVANDTNTPSDHHALTGTSHVNKLHTDRDSITRRYKRLHRNVIHTGARPLALKQDAQLLAVRYQ